MVMDSIRTLIIWVFSLAVGWQEFQYFQVIGFAFLILGNASPLFIYIHFLFFSIYFFIFFYFLIFNFFNLF